MRKIAEIEFKSEVINVYLDATGDFFEIKGQEFETEKLSIEYLKQFGDVEHAIIYEPDREGESIVGGLGYGGPVGVVEDGPGLYS